MEDRDDMLSFLVPIDEQILEFCEYMQEKMELSAELRSGFFDRGLRKELKAAAMAYKSVAREIKKLQEIKAFQNDTK